ncbi:proto-oncogene Mas-like [Rhinophrynus dorsalis]
MLLNSTEGTNFNSTHSQENVYDEFAYIHFTIAASVALGLCLIGMLGNVRVLFHLCIRIQRSKYTIYIINLLVADYIFLIFTAMVLMVNINTMIGSNPDFTGKSEFYLFLEVFYDASLYSGSFFLTIISVERCISVLFPSWYQRHRSKNMSAIICACLWILGCTMSLIENLVCSPKGFMSQTNECTGVELMTFIIEIGICLPLMLVSSIILLFMLRKNFKQQISLELYIFIIVAVFIFILAVIPFNLLWFLMYFRLLPTDLEVVSLFFASVYCTTLNCTLNPYIYFFAEKEWKWKSINVKQKEKIQSDSEKTNSTFYESNSEKNLQEINRHFGL